MEQTAKTLFDLVRRVPKWLYVGVFITLVILHLTTHSLWFIVPAALWLGLFEGAADRRWAMWACFAAALAGVIVLI
ncbi:hypothetical protein [Nitrospirillum amazonense]|uniref:hypothetical protein n=1 Tax=Nitrospirillum amazonense TaxID=28077 RepID=UPI0024127850|nr:hypothetical protein [Nitrospirillum amazonense]MDG3444602.1 hypothetical protein [Nitrospirillum amazonense]